MKKNLIIIILMISFQQLLLTQTTESLLSIMKPEVYQDVLINGNVIKEGVKNCSAREPYIESLLNHYERPFTVLDIGASQGYFSLKIASRYPACCCIMIEGDKTNLLPEICELNTTINNKLVVLEEHISVNNLRELSSCEHFDVVLALNVIHHFKNHWKEAIEAILTLGDYILIETPPRDCHTAANKEILPLIEDYLNQHPAAQIIGKVPRYGKLGLPGPGQKYATLYLLYMHKNILLKSSWGSAHERYYPINSTFTQKSIFKPRINKVIDWKPGINLWTFKHLHGKYPAEKDIKKEIERLATFPHGDFVPWNIIAQGNHLELIDWDENNTPNNIHNAELCLALLKKKGNEK